MNQTIDMDRDIDIDIEIDVDIDIDVEIDTDMICSPVRNRPCQLPHSSVVLRGILPHS